MTQQAATPVNVGPDAILFITLAAGFVLVPTIANVNATLVNGLLLLILIGMVLGNANRWLPYLTAAGKIGGGAAATSKPIVDLPPSNRQVATS